MSSAIDPRFMTAQNWTAQTSTVLLPFGFVPKLLSEDDWRSWASYVVNLPAVAALGPPRPEPYADWHSWARQFNQTVRLLKV